MGESWKEVARKKREEKERRKTASNPKESWKEVARQKRFEQEVGKVDESYIKNFTDYSNRFFDSAEEDYGKVGWGNASQSYLSRSTDYENLDYRRRVIQKWMERNQGKLDADTYNSLSSGLDYFGKNASGIVDSFKKAREFYSQFDTEDDYLAYKDYDDKSKFDLKAGEREIAVLENLLKEYKSLSRWETDEQGAGRAAQIRQQYGGEDEIKALISQKTAYLNQAKHIQEGIKFSGVSGSADFDQYRGYKTTIKENPAWWESGVGDTQYEWINNQGGFRETWEQSMADLNAKAGASSQSGVYFGPKESTYKELGYDHMTEDEIAIYNYYYAKEGKEKAQEYLDSIQETLNYRKATEMFTGMEGETAKELFFGAEAGFDQFKSGLSSLLNTEDDYIAQSAYQMASGMVREDLADDGIKLPDWMGGASLGQAGYDLITTSANMAPSILASTFVGMINPVAGQVTGNLLMGASAAGNAYQEKLNMGYTKEQARTYGVMVGSSEAVLGKILGGISKLGGGTISKFVLKNLDNVDNVLARFAKSAGGKILMNAGSEALEEGLQTVLEPYLWQAVSGEEANVEWEEALYSALMGFATGGVFEGVEQVSNTVTQNQQAKSIYGVDPGALVTEALEINPDNAFAQKMQERLDSGKELSGGQLNRLVQQNEAAIAKQAGGQKLFGSEQQTENEGDTQTENTPELNAQEYGRMLRAAEAAQEGAENTGDTVVAQTESVAQGQQVEPVESSMATAHENATVNATPNTDNATFNTGNVLNATGKDGLQVAEDGVTRQVSTGKEVQPKKIVSIEGGKVMIQTDNGKMAADDIQFGDGDTDLLWRGAVQFNGITSSGANGVIRAYRSGQPVATYLSGAAQEFRNGYYNMESGGEYADKLTKAQREIIYELGQKAAGENTARAQAKATAAKKATADKADAVDDKMKATGKVHFDRKGRTFDDKQETALKVMEQLSATLGVEFYVYESYVNDAGERVYQDENSNEIPADNGWYENGEIHIDLNAGTNTKGLMLYTVAHELTHWAREYSEAKYKILANVLMKMYAMDDVSVESLVYRTIEEYKEQGHELTWDDAFEEVVAKSMEDVLTSGNVVQMMAEVKQRDKRFWQKICDWFKNLVADLKAVVAAYKGYKPESVEGKTVAAMEGAIGILEGFYADMLLDAGDNFTAIKAQKNTTRKGGAKYSFAGSKSQTADHGALDRAKEMLDQGMSNETIRQQTGWFKGMDGKWRYEIDDSKMEIAENLSNYMRLGDLMRHDALYEAYPDLADIEVVFQSLGKGINGSYNPQFDSIDLSYNLKNDPFGLKDALAHELQHAIQNREGFTRGATAESWERKRKAGFDSRRPADIQKAQETEQELRRIQAEEPEFYRDMLELDAMTPNVPRGEIDWETLEKIEEDPIEWQQYDARREELEAKYGDMKVWDMNDLLYQREQAAKNMGRSGVELYYDTAGEIEARDVAKRRAKNQEQRKATPPRLGNEDTVFAEGAGQSDLAIGKTVNNKPFVIVEKDILEGVAPSDWVKTVTQNIRSKFPNGVTIGGNNIAINQQSRRELTYSGYMHKLKQSDPQVYSDKLKATDNLDEIIQATTDWINEGAKHGRTDNIQDFARGTVLIRIGSNDYSAEVVVGTKTNGTMLLYDILNLQKISISDKKTDASLTSESRNDSTDRQLASDTERLSPQDSQNSGRNRVLNNSIASINRRTPDVKGKNGKKFSARVKSYAEIEEERQKLRQREIELDKRKREAANDPELLQAMDDYSNLFTEVRGLLSKKRQGTATQAELDRIDEIKELREKGMERITELQESLGLNAIVQEETEIRETKEALRVASDAAWAREGAEKENKAVEKAGIPAAEYFRKKALKAFKTTTNFNEAGYLLPDGKLLNFSGGERGHRYRDHREIGEIYEATNGVAALNRFLNDGNIRIMAESPGIDLAAGVEPTKEQYAAIRRFINTNGVKDGQFFVDFSGTDGSRAGNYSYQGRVNADRVINDIKHYYATGEIREQSSISQFLYSKRNTELEKVNRVLEKENAELKHDIGYLKELLKLQKQTTGGTKFTKSSVEAAAGQLMKYADAKGDKTELAGLLNGVYEYIAGGKELTWDGVKEAAQPAVEWLQSHVRTGKKADSYAQDILRQIRGSRIYLDETQKKEVAYQFGSYNDFRKRMMGSVIIAEKDSISLDSQWHEWAGMYPNIFDPETTTNDMPGALLDAIDSLRNMTEQDSYGYDAELFAQDLLSQVYDSYWNVSTLYTVADKMQKEINRLKYDHIKRMAALRKFHNEKTAQLKQDHKEAMQRVRQEYRERMDKQRQEITERYQESRQKGIENRRKTEMRRKIRRTVMDLNKLLKRGDKKRNVKEDMQDLVAKALTAADILFMDNYSNEDMVRDGVGTELTEQEAKYMEEAQKVLAEIESAVTAEERLEAENRLRGKLEYRMNKLKDVFLRERARLNKTKVSEVLGDLADAYASLENSEQNYVSGAFDENVHQYLLKLKGDVGGTTVKDMSLNQLEELHRAYTMVLTTVRNANKMFAANMKLTREQLGNQTIAEVQKAGGEHGLWLPGEDKVNAFSWNNQKPVYAFERIGSDTLTQLFENTRAGEDTWAQDMTEAREYYLAQAKKHKYDSWDFGKQYKFTSTSGIEFTLGLEQIMSLYAYSKREQAHDHLMKGGFVFDSNTEVQVNKAGIKINYLNRNAKAHNVSMELLADIVSKLEPEQKAFVDEMQDYLSATMGEKGNEVSLQLYGVKLFKEKYYFPLRSASQYMERAKEADLKKEQGQISIVNSGFAKATTPKSSNPVVLSGFMDVWASHVNEMSMYHSFVLPMEDFRRVYNYTSPNMETGQSISVNSVIQNAYGKEATDYIDQLYRDLNGGAVSDPRDTPIKALMGKFKKAAVFASLSVVIQQPSAIGRAFAIVDPKYFVGQKVDHKRHKALWAQLKKYAPVAVIKEMGYFDTGMGKSAQDFIKGKEYGTIKEKAAALFTDKNYRDELLGKAPALADELTWCAIWEAVKRETKTKNKGLSVTSEEFLQLAGKRFTEVITRTQVYDSVLARSGNMRAKGLMTMWTAFMAEPTTTINMVEDALRKGKRGDKKYTARVMGAVLGSVVLNSALVSLVRAMRDDDEDETFLEKYAQSFATEILDGINPLTYYPFLKDIWSIMQGYDVERSDMSLISDLVGATTKVVQVLNKDTEDMDEEELAAHNKKLADAWWGVVDYVTALAGIPVKNVRRDIKGAINAVKTIAADLTGRDTSWGSLLDQTWDEVKNAIPVVGWLPDKTAADKLYKATVNGDEAYRKRLASSYDTQGKLDSAIRKGLRANDSRIWEAAIAWNNNDLETYKRLAREIIGEGHFSQDNVVMAIQAEAKAMQEKQSSTSESKAKGLFTAEKFAVAIAQGNDSMAEFIKSDIMETAMVNGKTEEDAENSFVSAAKSNMKELFMDGSITKNQAIRALVRYCGYEQEDAEVTVGEWAFENAYGFSYSDRGDAYKSGAISKHELKNILMDTGGMTAEDADLQIQAYDWEAQGYDGATLAAVREYNEHCAASNVPKDTYLYIRKFANNTKNDVDPVTGKSISYSAMKKVIAEIDAQPGLTDAQKDAIAYSLDWTAKNINKYKTW